VTKRQIAEKVSEKCGLGRATVNNVIDTVFDVIGDEVAAGNPVNLTGQLKIGFSATKPIKKGTMVRNPFNGETNPHPGKPAGLRVRVTRARS
jgi:nucleoid DNA-binding protein